MTKTVIISLPISIRPARKVEVQLPVVGNKVPGFEWGYCPTCSSCYPLDDFIECCERQAKAMTLIDEESTSVIDSHIGGLMTSIMSEVSMRKHISAEQLRMYMDCFSYILLADGFSIDEILKMRPNISRTIRDLYPSIIKD